MTVTECGLCPTCGPRKSPWKREATTQLPWFSNKTCFLCENPFCLQEATAAMEPVNPGADSLCLTNIFSVFGMLKSHAKPCVKTELPFVLFPLAEARETQTELCGNGLCARPTCCGPPAGSHFVLSPLRPAHRRGVRVGTSGGVLGAWLSREHCFFSVSGVFTHVEGALLTDTPVSFCHITS